MKLSIKPMIFLVLILGIGPLSKAQTTSELIKLREISDQAEKEKTSALAFAQMVNEKPGNNALYLGYQGLSKFLLAKHAVSPARKVEKFNSGKELLEKALELKPTSIELRYIRFATQTNIPSILNYAGSVSVDKKFILRYLTERADAMDSHLFERVYEFMLNSKACTPEEKQKLRQLN